MPNQSPPPLTVSWSMGPMPARRWLPWQVLPAESAEERALTESLGWPAHTLAVLNAAFTQKLDRETGWETALDGKPFLFAAGLYKRGVAFRPAPSQERQGSYAIRFHGLKDLTFASSTFVVVDQRVAESWPTLVASCPHAHVFDMSERTKTLASVAALRALWLAAGKPAHWTIIGGGVLADTASFAAALEGCAFTLVPTTLLAMVDACVGGKTGVNHAPYGKNQVGLFAFPDSVDVYPEILSTLPKRDLRAGWAEAFKHALLTGDEALVSLFQKPVATTLPAPELLSRFIAVKANVVAQDPTEQDVRATLNLGHTLAHALEAVALENPHPHDELRHGEAVALGILFCLILSAETGRLHDAPRMLSLLHTSGILPSRGEIEGALGVALSDTTLFPRLFQHFAQDKKAGNGRSRWILLDAPGRVRKIDGTYLCDVEKSLLEKSWQRFISFSF